MIATSVDGKNYIVDPVPHTKKIADYTEQGLQDLVLFLRTEPYSPFVIAEKMNVGFEKHAQYCLVNTHSRLVAAFVTYLHMYTEKTYGDIKKVLDSFNEEHTKEIARLEAKITELEKKISNTHHQT